jgi:hypothetical protein
MCYLDYIARSLRTVVFLILCFPTFAQITTGSIEGVVRDSSGGNCKVIVDAQGFKPLERTGLIFDVNLALVLDLTMELDTTQETVEVTARGTLFDTTTAEMGDVVDSRSLVYLPLNARNPWQLVFVAPGAPCQDLFSSNQ